MRSRMRFAAALAVPVALLGLAACSGSEDEGEATDESTASETVDTDTDDDTDNDTDNDTDDDTDDTPSADEDLTSGAEPVRECTAPDIEVLGGFGTTPRVVIPDDCLPPEQLIVKDLVKGTGPEAEAGGTVEANYLLVTWSDKVEADNSFDRGMTFPVSPLGRAQVIQGWNEGLVGMQQGTRRLLVVPPDLGYGPAGYGPIGPEETLVFVVDAVSVS